MNTSLSLPLSCENLLIALVWQGKVVTAIRLNLLRAQLITLKEPKGGSVQGARVFIDFIRISNDCPYPIH